MEVKKSPKADLAKSSPMFLEIGLIAALLITLLAFEWKSGNIKKAELSANDVIAAEEEIIPITEEENVVRPKMPTIPILSDAIDIVDDDIKVDEEMFSFEDSEDLGVDMNDYGKFAVAFAGSELPRAGGGARCMTMPILRDLVDS